MTTMVRLVTFASTDSVSLVAQPSVQLITGAVLTYMRVARLNDTRAIIGARSILENDRVYGAVLDVTTNTSILAVGPIAVISAGTSPNFSLPLGVTGAGPDRAVFTYYDYNGYPTVTDVGIYATSIVNGRFVDCTCRLLVRRVPMPVQRAVHTYACATCCCACACARAALPLAFLFHPLLPVACVWEGSAACEFRFLCNPPPLLTVRAYSEQPLFRGTNATGASVGVVALNDTLVIAITQPAFTGSARGANAFRCLLYGACLPCSAVAVLFLSARCR
jgi:hypothetical protein